MAATSTSVPISLNGICRKGASMVISYLDINLVTVGLWTVLRGAL